VVKILKNTIIILGFPGVGKTTYSKNTQLDVSDSDSSLFSWSDSTKTERHEDWPENYHQHIKSLIGIKDVIFVSTHKEVRDMLLQDKDLERRCYTIIPDGFEFRKYMDNYTNRGNDVRFLSLMEQKWDAFRDDAFKNGVGVRIILKPNQYIDDEIIKRLTAKEC
jgi:hypothetical protein